MLIRVIYLSESSLNLTTLRVEDNLSSPNFKIEDLLNLLIKNNSSFFKVVSTYSFKFVLINDEIVFDENLNHEEMYSQVKSNAEIDLDILLISPSYTLQYPLELPALDIKKVENIIKLELEDTLPFEIEFEKFHMVINNLGIESNNNYIVTLIEKNKLEFILKLLNTFDINPKIITNDLAIFYSNSININNTISETKNSFFHITDEDVLISISKHNQSPQIRSFVLSSDKDLRLEQIDNQLTHFLNTKSSSNDQKDINIIISSLDKSLINNFEDKIRESNKEILIKSIDLSLLIDKADPLNKLETEKLDHNNQSINSKILLAALSLLIESKKLKITSDRELSNNKFSFWNFRTGKFKYREPFSDLRESLISELVPISLFTICFILFSLSSFIIPTKKISVKQEEAYNLVSHYAPYISVQNKTIPNLINEVESESLNLDTQIGSLTSIRSLSPVDWLFRYSKLVDKNIDFILETFSISTEGLTLRGTVKDYPTSGRLDTLIKKFVEEDPKTFCSASISSDQGSANNGRLSVVGEVILCK